MQSTARQKISCCMIVGPGRAREAVRAIKSVRPYVDEVVIAFPCSKEADPELERLGHQYADKHAFVDTFDADGDPDFASSRNASYAMASHAWKLWIDSDDEIKGAENLRSLVKQGEEFLRSSGKEALWFMVAHMHGGKIVPRERLTKDAKATWIYNIHEVLDPSYLDHVAMVRIPPEQFRVMHEPGSRNGGERNIRVLRKCLAKDPKDARSKIYLGNETIQQMHYLEGIQACEEWLSDDSRDKACDLWARLLLIEAYGTLMLAADVKRTALAAVAHHPTAAMPKRCLAWCAFIEVSKHPTLAGWKEIERLAQASIDDGEPDPVSEGQTRVAFTADVMRLLVGNARREIGVLSPEGVMGGRSKSPLAAPQVLEGVLRAATLPQASSPVSDPVSLNSAPIHETVNP